MPILMSCPSCGREYNLADTMEGKTVRCKDCDETFTVADPGDDAGFVTADSRRKRGAGPGRGRGRDE